MTDKPSKISARFGVLVLVMGVFFVSWAAVLIRLCQSAPTTVAFFRMFFSTIMVALAIPFHRGKWFDKRSDLLISVLSGIFLGAHFFLWIASLKFTSISSSLVLVTTQPVFVAVLGYFFLKEGIGKLGILAIILAIFGAFMVAGGDLQIDGIHLKGDMLALGGALAAGLYLFIGRSVRPRVDLLPYVLTVYAVSSFTIVILGAISGSIEIPVVKSDYLWFFLLALGPTILGHNLYNFSLRHLPAFPVGMSILGEPVLGTIWGIIIFRELPIYSTYIGGSIIIAAVVIVMSRLKTEPRAVPS